MRPIRVLFAQLLNARCCVPQKPGRSRQNFTRISAPAIELDKLMSANIYKPVSKVPDFPGIEREMLRFWEEKRIFHV
jgi:hypothetical protein